MANYVKFLRGTPAAYNAIAEKDRDTLYFISEAGASFGKLYLGSKLIAGSNQAGDMAEVISLKDLTDVEIATELTAKQLLVYNVENSIWENKSFDEVVMVGASSSSDSVVGLVPQAKAGEQDFFLRGDGTWASVQSEIGVFEIVNSENKSHSEVLPSEASNGDLAIVKDLIFEGKYQFTSYIKTSEGWKALDEGYNSNNVYFNEDIEVSDQILATKGKTLNEVVQILYKEDAPEILGDNLGITLEENKISLKDFGKRYYRYVAETGEGEELVAAHYELQEVDENHPWKAGLEPKVVSEDNILVLGWYEPNPTTIEGVNSQVSAIQTTVADLQSSIGDLNSKNDELEEAISTKAEASEVYTKVETEALISSADHLKRKIVEKYEDIQTYIDTQQDENQYIFMVPTEFNDYDNKYYEYVVIDGVIEEVGNWSVDLSDYATITQLGTKVDKVEGYGLISESNITKLEGIEEEAEKNIIQEVDANFKIEDRVLTIVSLPNDIDLKENSSIISIKQTLEQSIDNKVSIEEGKELIPSADIIKLGTIQEGAEKNYINAVSEEFKVDAETRTLSIISIDGVKVDLTKNEDFSNLSSKVNSSSTEIVTIREEIDSIKSSLDDVWAQITWEDMSN